MNNVISDQNPNYHLGASKQEQNRLRSQLDLYGDTQGIVFKSTDHVCEFGCGPLSNAWIPPMVPDGSYTGIDIQAEHIIAGRSRAKELGLKNVTLLTTDGKNISLEAASFDVVFARCLLIHIPNTQELLHEMWRVLKPGGRLILIEPHNTTYFVSQKPNLLACHQARDSYAYQSGKGNRDAAMNLYTYLVQLGAKNIQYTPCFVPQ